MDLNFFFFWCACPRFILDFTADEKAITHRALCLRKTQDKNNLGCVCLTLFRKRKAFQIFHMTSFFWIFPSFLIAWAESSRESNFSEIRIQSQSNSWVFQIFQKIFFWKRVKRTRPCSRPEIFIGCTREIGAKCRSSNGLKFETSIASSLRSVISLFVNTWC